MIKVCIPIFDASRKPISLWMMLEKNDDVDDDDDDDEDDVCDCFGVGHGYDVGGKRNDVMRICGTSW